MSISDDLGLSLFCRKMKKTRLCKKQNGWKSCLLPARVGIWTLIFIDVSNFPLFYLALVSKQFWFPLKKRYKLDIWKHRGTKSLYWCCKQSACFVKIWLLIFPLITKKSQSSNLSSEIANHFFTEKWHLWGKKVSSHEQRKSWRYSQQQPGLEHKPS